MKKQTAATQAAQEYAGRNFTSGTWGYADARLAFVAGWAEGVRWERARRRREEKKEFKKSPSYAIIKALDAAEKLPKRKINLIAKAKKGTGK